MNEIVCGRRAEGKSTFALYRARLRHGAGVVVFDPRGMFDGERCYSADEVDTAIRSGAWQHGPIIYIPDGDVRAALTDLCEVLFPPQFTRFNFSLIVDEANQVQSPHSPHAALERAVRLHPIDRITIIQTTHRLADLHGLPKALMDDLTMFCTTHPGDLDVLYDYSESPEVVEIVKTLPHHHALHYSYSRQHGGQWEVLDDPAKWFTPISVEVAA